MRLIDADAYKDFLCRNCVDVGCDFYGARDISRCPCGKLLDIEYRPTAFDVDKVIEELDKHSIDNTDCSYSTNPELASYYLLRTKDAIEAVRKGGVGKNED